MHRYFIVVALIIALVDRANSDILYRLNTTIKPKAYSIAITPYFNTSNERAFTFDGEVNITFVTEAATKQIKLHSEDLLYNASNIFVVNGLVNLNLDTANPLEFDKHYTFAFINLQDDLEVGVEYSLKISYTGPIREDSNGFYKSYYIEKGVKKWLGATQMEHTHARKVFPCFDEPELKATFTLTIDRPENYKPSLANTKLQHTVPLANGYVREIFYPTPIMSTYLVAFLVSEFEGVEIKNGTQEFGVFTRPEALNQTEYTLEFGMRVLEALGNYFGIDFYSTDANLKLNHVALPELEAGGMENWGLINYKESCVLYAPEDSNPYYKYQAAQVVAHETTHMWFGNLVTCHWWSDLWLNEGFAAYFQYYITSLIEPELGSDDIVTGAVYNAYVVDSSLYSAPISNNNVNSPAEIQKNTGYITYHKAGSVIRMMHHVMGDEAFKLGLHSYLEANKFKSGNPDKLYEALEIGARNYSALAAYPDTDIAEVMSSWISQPGYPILHVEVNYENDTVVLRQKRFCIGSTNETYNIPVTFTTQRSPDFNNTKPAFIMKNATHEFTIANISQDHSWVLFNIQETGLYRVNYDDRSWQMISNALKGADRLKIHHLNRAKIVNDLFAFLYFREISFYRLTDILDFLTNEEDNTVWYSVIQGLKKLWDYMQWLDRQSYSKKDLPDYEGYTLELLEIAINKLGYEVRETDDVATLRNRMEVLKLACNMGHTGCIEHTVRLFRGLKENGTEITPSLRPVAYCSGLRSDADSYDFLQHRMATTNVAIEARIIQDTLRSRVCIAKKQSTKFTFQT